MKLLIIVFTIFFSFSFFSSKARAEQHNGINEQQLQQLQNRMLGDPKIMELISALQNDPEMLALLSDSAFLLAVSNRDVNALTKDPRFAKLLNNQKIREIIRRVE